MSLSIEEGYIDAVMEESEDCDHGPCIGYDLGNGIIVWTYPHKPGLISFHDYS